MPVTYHRRARHAGFTLIELIVVLVILGVLAAFALSRFADLGDDAELSVFQGTVGSFESAVNIVHAAWFASGINDGVFNLSSFEEPLIDVNSNGWPVGTTEDGAGQTTPDLPQTGNGGVIDANNNGDCMTLFDGVIENSFVVQPAGGTGTSPTAAAALAAPDTDIVATHIGNEVCQYVFVSNPALFFTFDSLSGLVAVNPALTP